MLKVIKGVEIDQNGEEVATSPEQEELQPRKYGCSKPDGALGRCDIEEEVARLSVQT